MIEQPEAPHNQPTELIHQEVHFPSQLGNYYDLDSAIPLGEGSLGTTFQVKRKDSDSYDVLKKMTFVRYFSCAWDVWEDGSHGRTKHGNMIETFSECFPYESHFLMMKWMEKGNLKTLVGFGERKGFACLLDVCCVLSGVVDALSFLESTNRAFGALHLSNILVGEDNRGILGDMLFSKPNIRDAFDVRSDRALHLAPELMDEPDLYIATPQSDVWAFGILLLESVLGLNPFSSMEGDRLRDGVRGLNLDVFFESLSSKHSKRASPSFCLLVKECLKQNPSERITFKSMKERQLIRSLLSLPEDIVAFDATTAQQNEPQTNEWTMVKVPITPESHVIVKNRQETVFNEDHSFIVTSILGRYYQFSMKCTNDTVKSLMQTLLEREGQDRNKRCYLMLSGRILCPNRLLGDDDKVLEDPLYQCLDPDPHSPSLPPTLTPPLAAREIRALPSSLSTLSLPLLLQATSPQDAHTNIQPSPHTPTTSPTPPAATATPHNSLLCSPTIRPLLHFHPSSIYPSSIMGCASLSFHPILIRTVTVYINTTQITPLYGSSDPPDGTRRDHC
ncbi:putative Protein kinase domain containing protein [Blattamonas nauphoetae]|uniref:Protein kinase domain-containing protein n=1 Tax=Blattamonas nauphoetae TaxID=2049346 RepID=A0ABQ9YCI5_9EUKA|nr:putative Protein kinase domain containing protein [Blattamonas nauphoetae]